MSVITVARENLTAAEVVTALRDGLGPRYTVQSGMAMGRTVLQTPRSGPRHKIVVGKGEMRVVKAQVTVIPRGSQTALKVSAGGVTLDLIYNTLGLGRRIRRVLLAASPSLLEGTAAR